ncbi:hypothetical protein [Nostoc sp. ATCC 53789]|uniref:hypothetical protein n=1 Tax=Nostoc sp. ATCC 53789 TaxID=76335 RepID=UPI000DECB3CA|nr:hypothetical protein [Nostoc sp. ATCC 53789]QHG20812.1 hypothetical protein GJB62_33570 [Nostoc sp. ATCC 53789]RCJ25215.1 hypothetical protein A6V25_21185 [Nostoc sp. ATCC 53789]
MTTDLVTYYGQTPTIDQLVDKYGVYLEKLDRQTKLMLRMALATYIFTLEKDSSTKHTVAEALEDALSNLGLLVSYPLYKNLFEDVCSVLNGLTTLEAETLLEALQHQIRWGNAQKLAS